MCFSDGRHAGPSVEMVQENCRRNRRVSLEAYPGPLQVQVLFLNHRQKLEIFRNNAAVSQIVRGSIYEFPRTAGALLKVARPRGNSGATLFVIREARNATSLSDYSAIDIV